MKKKETLQAVIDRLAELELVKEQIVKPFYEEQAELMAKLEVGKVYQASNGICLMTESCDGQYIYNKTHVLKRTKVCEDGASTLAAKTVKEAGLESSIPATVFVVAEKAKW